MNATRPLIVPSLLSLAIASAMHSATAETPAAAPAIPPASITRVEFIGSSLPTTPEQMASVFTDAQVKLSYADGTTQTRPLAYNLLYKTGDSAPNGVIGGSYFNANGKPVQDADGKQLFADAPDGQSLLNPGLTAKPGGVTGFPLFLVTQFEYRSGSYGELASGMGLSLIDQQADGRLTLVNYKNVDASGVQGLWMTCAATLSPWNTHLASEEYEPDAFRIADKPEDGEGGSFSLFSQSYFGNATKANPYHYGHIPELSINAAGRETLAKHYATGRFSHEMIQMMPDQRTGLMTDDAINATLYLFVADKPADLSAGTLYAAKWIQKSSDGAGEADLQWVRLGHGNTQELKALADTTKPSDILEVRKQDPNDKAFRKIQTHYGTEWVKVKQGKEQAAAFLETRRYAALKDATAEFSKMEGVAVNVALNTAYVAMARIERSMTAVPTAPADHIRLKENRAGAVYALDLRGSQKDTDGQAIDSAYVPVTMRGLLTGVVQETDAQGNGAALDQVANPDNLKYSPALGVLFIGEDSELHVNNMLWAYNVSTRSLTRLATAPVGAEITGLQAVDNLNGHAYVMANFQHPGDKTDFSNPALAGVEELINQHWGNKLQGAVGYLGGIPGLPGGK